MTATATIDVTAVRVRDDGYRVISPEHSITDAEERLARGNGRPSITDDPARGLSRLQRQILGVAYTMHVYGQRAHAGSIPDYVTPLGVYVLYGIAPDLAYRGHRFTRTAKVASAQAALSRAVTRLMQRKLLAWRSGWPDSGNGYVLTDAGRAIGARDPVPVPQIDRSFRYFGLVGLRRWHQDDSGQWVATPSHGGQGAGYEYTLSHEDCEALGIVPAEPAA